MVPLPPPGDALFIWDHLAWAGGIPSGDPWISLAAAAATATPRIALGLDVSPLPRRRPQVVATAVAALDRLSNGRVVFGAGLGGSEAEYTTFGEVADAKARASKLDEGLEILDRLWRGQRVEHHGSNYTVAGSSSPGESDLPRDYESAGATWWLECVHDLRGPLDEMLERVRAGP